MSIFKLKEDLENTGFIDKNFTYPFVNLFIDTAYNIKLTPNIITTITLIIRLVCVYFLYNNIYVKGVPILYFISWITDAMDGQLARKYDMKTEFGGLYDSIVDITTHILLFLILYIKYNKIETLILFILHILIFLLLSLKKVKNKNDTKFWEKILNNIFNKNNTDLYITKYLDPGLAYFITLLYIIYLLWIILFIKK